YPKWHGTLDDLKNNLTDLSVRYKQDIIVVEYTEHKREVNDIAFNLPDGKGKGTCIWEPLNTWEYFTGKDGKTNDLIKIYDEIAKKYNIK
ncbi:MAG: glycosyl hydrolase 53 family protein, partial [Bacteroidota bacterium]